VEEALDQAQWEFEVTPQEWVIVQGILESDEPK
jgi:hypothetical protein